MKRANAIAAHLRHNRDAIERARAAFDAACIACNKLPYDDYSPEYCYETERKAYEARDEARAAFHRACYPVVRVWIWHKGSPVRITLAHGQPVDTYEGGPTEEGYDDQHNRYQLWADSEEITNEYSRSARDCDGRMDWGEDYICPVTPADIENDDPRERFCDWMPRLDRATYDDPRAPRCLFPNWQKESSYQRDHAAEAAGY
jgi:hypothetical protein